MEGWIAYAIHRNTYNIRMKFIKKFEEIFIGNIADVEINRWLKAYKGIKQTTIQNLKL